MRFRHHFTAISNFDLYILSQKDIVRHYGATPFSLSYLIELSESLLRRILDLYYDHKCEPCLMEKSPSKVDDDDLLNGSYNLPAFLILCPFL